MKVDEALCRDCEKGVKEINVKRFTMYISVLQCQYIVSVCACLCVCSCTLSFCSDYLTNGLSNLFIVYALRCCRCTQQPDRQICVLCAVCAAGMYRQEQNPLKVVHWMVDVLCLRNIFSSR